MGYIFEELLRRFSEMSNETAGEHFTPREVIRLMVNILFSQDDKALSGQMPVRTLYDPACGTGGMLTVAQDHLAQLNPDAVLEVFGQELNPETWAVCRSDLMIKGQDPSHIVLGNSFTDDGFTHERFDYLLANPPFGVDWKKYQAPVKDEHDNLGFDGRFGPGLPRVSDGSLLFLMHMISKMKPVADDPATPDIIEGGTRLAIVFSGHPCSPARREEGSRRSAAGSSRTTGSKASSPSRTSCSTTPASPPTSGSSPTARPPTAPGRSCWWMRGNRGRRCARASATNASTSPRRHHRGHPPVRRRPRPRRQRQAGQGVQPGGLRLPAHHRRTATAARWELTHEAIEDLTKAKAWRRLGHARPSHRRSSSPTYAESSVNRPTARRPGNTLGVRHATERTFNTAANKALRAADVDPPRSSEGDHQGSPTTPDPDAPIITEQARAIPNPTPTCATRRTSPSLPDGSTSPRRSRPQALIEQAEQHLETEIRPYAPDAWIDHTKTKIGYEIPFTRHFYEYIPPRPLEAIDAELAQTEQRIQELLAGLVR